MIVPLLQDELPKDLERKVVSVLRLDIRSREDEVRSAAAEALAEHVAARGRESVERLRGQLRAGGLAVAGVREVLEALEKGRADEVWITTALAETVPTESRGSIPLGDEIVQRALATSSRVRFAENPDLLADLGGIVASLRYRPVVSSRDNSPVERKVEA